MIQAIALAGTARSGKDTLAAPLIRRGWHKMAFGDHIKAFFREYVAGDESIAALRDRMFAVNPELTFEAFTHFYGTVLFPFEEHDLMCDSFTEYDDHKRVIRPILEHGGELIYPWVFGQFFGEMDAALERGQRVINTRLVRVPEAQAWVERGGVIYLVERENWSPATLWEAEPLAELRESGLVTRTLCNAGTAGDWDAFAQHLADELTQVVVS